MQFQVLGPMQVTDEQGAEIISWALGNRILTAQIPDNGAARLAAGFELLTGIELPAPG